MQRKNKILWACLLMLLPIALGARSKFIAHAKHSAPTRTRNQVKEEFGGQLQMIARLQADLQHQVGLFMMRQATLQQVVVRQGGNLLEDSHPFDSIGTARLSRAVDASQEKARQLQDLLAQVSEVNNELLSIVRLEDDSSSV